MISKLVVLALLFPSLSSAACIPFDQAQKHIGETQCVSGKVLRVESGSGGVHYLDFCEDHERCPFSVVVFASDLNRIGEAVQLAGKLVEIRGEVKEYDGRAEIILDHAKQLGAKQPDCLRCRKCLMWSRRDTSAREKRARRTDAARERRKTFRLSRSRFRRT